MATILWAQLRRLWPYLLVILLLLSALWFYNYQVDSSYDDGYKTGVEWQKQQQANSEQLLKKSHEYEKEVIENEAQSRINAANAATAAAKRNANSLFAQLDEIKRNVGNSTSINTSGKTASETVNMLTDLFRESVERGNEMADYADRASNAGLTCERSYDSLRNVNGKSATSN